jgi:hypothetical protein
VGDGRRTWAALAISIAVLTVFAGCAYPVAAKPACADAVLDDWTRGTLDSTHPQDCYDAAIEALPEDLRSYTSAADDISRVAISASRSERALAAAEGAEHEPRQLAGAAPSGDGVRTMPLPVVLLTATVLVLAACGTAASFVRRRRAR